MIPPHRHLRYAPRYITVRKHTSTSDDTRYAIRAARCTMHDARYTARAEAFSADDEYSLRHPRLPRQPPCLLSPLPSFAISCRPPSGEPSGESRSTPRAPSSRAPPRSGACACALGSAASRASYIPIAAHRSRVASRLATRNPEFRFQQPASTRS